MNAQKKLTILEASLYTKKHKNTISNHLKNKKHALTFEWGERNGHKVKLIKKDDLDKIYNIEIENNTSAKGTKGDDFVTQNVEQKKSSPSHFGKQFVEQLTNEVVYLKNQVETKDSQIKNLSANLTESSERLRESNILHQNAQNQILGLQKRLGITAPDHQEKEEILVKVPSKIKIWISENKKTIAKTSLFLILFSAFLLLFVYQPQIIRFFSSF